MNSTPRIYYAELTRSDVCTQAVADINRLLPQLSTNATPISEEWLSYLLGNGTRLFVARHNEQIIGTVLLCRAVIVMGRKDWIEDVIVDSDYRNLGIASHLMDITEAASRKRGAKSINLTSHPDRTVAREMYRRHGYIPLQTNVFAKPLN